METLSHRPRGRVPGISLPVVILVLGLVVAFVLLEYVFDWPIHLRQGGP
ncbi:hypothetical protein J8J14_22960 [Roseomonas sp. SSH11]|uniref:ABC transporter permease n=1 Tax=Pararoseomonas baculiformis TaxID=2820812 RepID=A0ABS4AM84_9PROT|nr:hypothetical protein [Pararoseomonas baculiformis]MBP0447623.1 hypothetical protein [Pararoseomonas baculiformis]